MLNRIIFGLILGASSFSATARDYVPGDGSLDFVCSDKDEGASPYNSFKFEMLYDQSADLGLGNLEQVLQSGDGTIVYKVTVNQSLSKNAGETSEGQALFGCESAPLKMIPNEDGLSSKISFFCDGDSAPFGEINVDFMNDELFGSFSFPGGSSLFYPIEANKVFELQCDIE